MYSHKFFYTYKVSGFNDNLNNINIFINVTLQRKNKDNCI